LVDNAQVGNWKSWANVRFNVPGRAKPRPAHDLLSNAVFYKVGHHCSHNATLKRGARTYESERPGCVHTAGQGDGEKTGRQGLGHACSSVIQGLEGENQ
jgi:hypothetical protein